MVFSSGPEPDYQRALVLAGWQVYIEWETVMHESRSHKRLILRAIKVNLKAKVSADSEFQHGAWRELFELAQQLDPSLHLK